MIDVASRRAATDAEVIRRSLAEPEAFHELFDRYYRLVHRFLVARGAREAADDVAAETFVVAFRRRGDYDAARGDARSWLFGIAVNLARNQHRADVRRLRALTRLAERPEDPEQRTLDRLAAEALPLDAAMAALSEDERDLLLLFACLDFTYDELADALALPPGTVRSRLHRARTKVRARLEGGDTR